MLNREKHQLIMTQILKDIYTEVSISSSLGFKGGTCAYLFYNLPRFSVDLDFDLLNNGQTKQKVILEKIETILNQYGTVKDKYIKRHTIFLLLSYGDADHNIKIEINTVKPVSNIADYYEPKKYLGILILTANKDYILVGKLAALATRKELVMRDIYDAYFFAKNNFDLNSSLVELITGKSAKELLTNCIDRIEANKNISSLQGLGELLGSKEKAWVKEHLKDETIFILKNYLTAISSANRES